nr:MAG TPA: hypothetical protein [Caudoviricetes sp.]
MEKMLIDAISSALPNIDIYHDFAPEEAVFPLVVIRREGGAGRVFIDHAEETQKIRFSVSVWDTSRLSAVEKSLSVERSVLSLLEAYALSAAESVVLEDGRCGMVQDFVVTA